MAGRTGTGGRGPGRARILVIGRQNRAAAVGAALVVAGVGLVAGGLVDSALERTGMKGAL